jgi:hypothetical protein
MILSCLFVLLDFDWLLRKLFHTFIVSLSNCRLGDYLHCIYPNKLWVKDTTHIQRYVSYLDLHLEMNDLVLFICITRFRLAFDKGRFVCANTNILISLFSIRLWEATLNQLVNSRLRQNDKTIIVVIYEHLTQQC